MFGIFSLAVVRSEKTDSSEKLENVEKEERQNCLRNIRKPQLEHVTFKSVQAYISSIIT